MFIGYKFGLRVKKYMETVIKSYIKRRDKMSKELEALKEIYNGMSNNIGFVKEFKNVEQALAEHEELKRDVKRYFDLGHIEEPSTEQFEEYLKLTDKLLKVRC